MKTKCFSSKQPILRSLLSIKTDDIHQLHRFSTRPVINNYDHGHCFLLFALRLIFSLALVKCSRFPSSGFCCLVDFSSVITSSLSSSGVDFSSGPSVGYQLLLITFISINFNQAVWRWKVLRIAYPPIFCIVLMFNSRVLEIAGTYIWLSGSEYCFSVASSWETGDIHISCVFWIGTNFPCNKLH